MGWSSGISLLFGNGLIKNTSGIVSVVPDTANAISVSTAGVGVITDNATIKVNSSNEIYAVTTTFIGTNPITYTSGTIALLYDNLTLNLDATNQLELNTNNANTWTANQTFPDLSITNAMLATPITADTTTITDASGVVSVNLTNANTWSGVQTFGNSISIGSSVFNIGTLSTNDIIQYNGTNWVNTPITPPSIITSLNVNELELTATTSTTIGTFTPSTAGNFVVNAYFRVITTSTTITLQVTYTDVSGAQTYEWVSSVLEPIGSYSMVPLYINSTATAITISATAGTINQAFISSSIISII